MNEVSREILSGVVPIWSQTIFLTRSSIEESLTSLLSVEGGLGGLERGAR